MERGALQQWRMNFYPTNCKKWYKGSLKMFLIHLRFGKEIDKEWVKKHHLNKWWLSDFFFLLLLIKTWIGLSIDQSEEASYKRFLSCCAILPARIARNQLLIDSWARKKQLAELKGNDEDLSWSIFIIGKPSGKLTKNLTYMIFQRCLVRNVIASISQRYRN